MGELIAALVELIVSATLLMLEFLMVVLEVLLNLVVASFTIIAYALSSRYRSKKQREWAAQPRRKYYDLGVSGTCLAALIALTIWFFASDHQPPPPEIASNNRATTEKHAKPSVNGTNRTSITVKPGGIKQIMETRTLSELAGAIRSNVTVAQVDVEVPYATIEPVGDAPSTYRFTGPDHQHRISFRVPVEWSLSHPPTGGIAGASSFSNSSRPGATLLIQTAADGSVSQTTSQAELLKKLEQEDRDEEPMRIAFGKQMVESIRKGASANSKDGATSVTIADAPKSDLAKFDHVAQQETSDLRHIWILHISSPGRGQWFHALIPETGFTTQIQFHPETDSTPENDIALIKEIVSSYSHDKKQTTPK
jgi:hypothetical protein